MDPSDKTKEQINWMKAQQKNKKKLHELAAKPDVAEATTKEASDMTQCELTLRLLDQIPLLTKQAFVPGEQISAMPVLPDGSPMPPEMQQAMAQQGMPPGGDPAMMGGGMPPGMPPGMPMDPAMMGGGMPPGMPMDPAMMGQPMMVGPDGMPIDPAMMDPAMMQAVGPDGMPIDPVAAEEGAEPEVDINARLSGIEKQIGELADIVAGMQDESGSIQPAPTPTDDPEADTGMPQAPLTGQSTRDAMGKLRTGVNNPDTLARVMGTMQG